MGIKSDIKDMEHRVRSSSMYHEWVERHLGPGCINCDSTDHLQVHHVIELYHILLGLWRLYGDVEDVVCHAIAMHTDNACEAVTLCKECHSKNHPGKHISQSTKKARIEDWAALPRNLPGRFSHRGGDGLSLPGAQLLACLGWHILGGRMDSRMVEFERPRMSGLLGKKRCTTSFRRSVDSALSNLQDLGVLAGHHVSGPRVETHLSPSYLEDLQRLPWFMAMSDVRTSKAPVFALRWFLGLQSSRRNYKIGKDKLVTHLGLRTSTPAFVERCVRNACEETPWAHCDYDGTFFSFRLKRRGAVPIWTLRTVLQDAIREGS